MDRDEALVIIEQWCRQTTTHSAHDCRKLAASLVDRTLAICRDPSHLNDARRTIEIVPRTDAATRLRRCLEHQNPAHARRVSEFELERTAGLVWLWITEDLFGVEHVFRSETGTAVTGPRG